MTAESAVLVIDMKSMYKHIPKIGAQDCFFIQKSKLPPKPVNFGQNIFFFKLTNLSLFVLGVLMKAFSLSRPYWAL